MRKEEAYVGRRAMEKIAKNRNRWKSSIPLLIFLHTQKDRQTHTHIPCTHAWTYLPMNVCTHTHASMNAHPDHLTHKKTPSKFLCKNVHLPSGQCCRQGNGWGQRQQTNLKWDRGKRAHCIRVGQQLQNWLVM